MPATFNGIGTRYWGRAHLHGNAACCEFCGRYGNLRSYDTTLFIVFLFLPLLPLGRYRVLHECPHCRHRRAMRLREWNRRREVESSSALHAFQKNPADPDLAGKLIQTAVTCQDKALLFSMKATLLREHAKNEKVLRHAAAACDFFSDLKSAEALYRQSLSLRDDRETREALAVNLIRQLRPAEAEQQMGGLPEPPSQSDWGFLSLLVEGYQAVGEHDRALEILESCRASVEELAGQPQFQQYLRKSRRGKRRGRPEKSALFLNHDGRWPAEGPVLWRFRAPVVLSVLFLILLAGGGAGVFFRASYRAGQAHPVHFVNGLSQPYKVELAGREVELPPGRVVILRLPEGALSVRVVGDNPGIPVQEFQVQTPFFKRLFLDTVYVVNPDRTAILMWEETVYTKSHAPEAGNTRKLYTGLFFQTFAGLDYVFEPFPQSLPISPRQEVIRKRRLSLVSPASPHQALAVVESVMSREETVDFIQRKIAAHPEDLYYLASLERFLEDSEYIEYLRSRLPERPPLIEWHRVYQGFVERKMPEYSLESEYRESLAREPTNAVLMYLLGRVLDDGEESKKLYQQSTSDPVSRAHGFNALAFYHLGAGDFATALDLVRSAVELDPQNGAFLYVLKEALLALGRYDELLEINLRAQKSNPYDGELIREELRLRLHDGSMALAQRSLHEFCSRMSFRSFDAAERWRLYLTASSFYLQGNTNRFAAMMAELPGDELKFEAALTRGDIPAADEILNRVPVTSPYPHLLLYIAATLSGKKDIAARQLENAVDQLSRGDRRERLFGRYLAAQRLPMKEQSAQIRLRPQEKRILMTALTLKFPEHRARLASLAGKLNYDSYFPHLLLKKALEP